MRALAFLSTERRELFSGAVWPEPGTALGEGAIGLRGPQVLTRMDDELWVVELDEPLADRGDVVVAAGGTLVEQVVAWDDATAREFALACVDRVRSLACDALRRAGGAEPESLIGLPRAAYAEAAVALAPRLPQRLASAILFAADIDALAQGLRPEEYGLQPDPNGASRPAAIAANVAFVAAHAAGSVSPDGHDAGFAAERAWQLDWLEQRLGLETRPAG